MARKIARKSNKTSHVLNLLTDPKRSDSAADEVNEVVSDAADLASATDADAAYSEDSELLDTMTDATQDCAEPDIIAEPESAPTKSRSSRRKQTAPPKQPLVDLSQTLEERISQQIHDSLSAQLAEEEEKEAERTEKDRQIAERIAVEMGALAEAAPLPSDTQQLEDTSDTVESSTTEPQADVPKKPKLTSEFELVNVMDAILDQFQADFMEKFGMCTCRRCQLDTRALTLSSLNGKYVVLEQDSIGSMLNFYDHRFRGMIMAQLTQACIAVMANPHH